MKSINKIIIENGLWEETGMSAEPENQYMFRLKKAMSEYAKEVSIGFAQWLREDKYSNIVGYEKFSVAGKSTEELFELFIKENKL